MQRVTRQVITSRGERNRYFFYCQSLYDTLSPLHAHELINCHAEKTVARVQVRTRGRAFYIILYFHLARHYCSSQAKQLISPREDPGRAYLIPGELVRAVFVGYAHNYIVLAQCKCARPGVRVNALIRAVESPFWLFPNERWSNNYFQRWQFTCWGANNYS